MISDHENQIIGLIYDAAINPYLWKNVLEEICIYTGSSTSIYTYMDQLNPKQNFVVAHNISEKELITYAEENLDVIDMRIHGDSMKQKGVGQPYTIDCSSYEFMPNSDELKFFEKCLKPSNICYLNGVLLDYGPYKWAVIAVHRPNTASRYQQNELIKLERIAKHLRRSLQIYRHYHQVQAENSDYYKLFNQLDVGVILLNAQAELYFSNDIAQQVLRDSKELWIDQKNNLKTSASYQVRLDQLIESCLNKSSVKINNKQEQGGVMGISIPNHAQPIMLTIFPLTDDHSSELNQIARQKVVAIFISKPSEKKIIPPGILKDLFSLSPREVEICDLFLNGSDFEKLAEHCSITMSSLRTYMKIIYSKTGCNSQTELLRLLHGLTQNFKHIE